MSFLSKIINQNTLVRVAWVALSGVLISFVVADRVWAAPMRPKLEYAFADSNVERPSQLQPHLTWSEFIPQKNNLAPQKNKNLWLKMSFPGRAHQPSTLKFEKVFMRFKVFTPDDALLYSFGDTGGYAGLPPHLVTFGGDHGHSVYFMRVESEHQRIGPVGQVAVGQRSDFILQMIREDVVPFFVSSILILLSVSGLILFSLHRGVRTYLHLALFSVCTFFYIAGGLRLRHALGLDPALVGNLSLLGLFTAPLFFILFYREIFSIQMNIWMRVAMTVNVAFLGVSGVGYFMSPLGLLPFLKYFYAFAVPIFATVFIHSIVRMRAHPYAKTFYLGFVFLFLGGLWEMANEIRLINSNIRMLHIGVLLFFLCLTAMQGQFFANLFQTAKRNAISEMAARNRLQRVFDCTYALAQARHYKDALRTVAIAISHQLRLADAQFSIDFMIARAAVTSFEKDSEEFMHFTFVSQGNTKDGGEVFEVSRQDVDKPQNSLLPISEREQLSSLPGIEIAQSLPETVLTVPLETDALEGALIIRRYDSKSFAWDDQNQLIKFINAVSASLLIALKNIEYLRDMRKKAQIEAQLDAAESIQAALLPPALSLENLGLASFSRSAGKTGGDWFGHFHSVERKRLFVTIGDVTGHDFAASILTGVAAGIIKSWEFYNSDSFESASEALEHLAAHVNRVMLDASRGLKFMSMLFCCIELETGVFHVVNAGHPFPLQVSPGQAPSSIAASGSLLGANPDGHFQAETVTLGAGDTVLLFTDGLIENTGPNGETLSRRAIAQFCRSNALSANNIDAFVQFIDSLWQKHPAEDDVSIVALTWIPDGNASRNAA